MSIVKLNSSIEASDSTERARRALARRHISTDKDMELEDRIAAWEERLLLKLWHTISVLILRHDPAPKRP